MRYDLPLRRGDYVRLRTGATGTVMTVAPSGAAQAFLSTSGGQMVDVAPSDLAGAVILNRRAEVAGVGAL
jgi:hypothetical protein